MKKCDTMKKLLYLLLFGGFLCFFSCEKEATNPGDFNLKSELEMIGVTTRNGKAFDLKVLRSIDTTYVRFHEKKDTVKDKNGEYLLDDKGNVQPFTDTIYYAGKLTAKFVEIEKIVLDTPADTVFISLVSNAKWLAPMPSSGGKVQWFFTQRLAGGGDGNVIANVTRNRSFKRAVDAVQYVFTSDSATMYKLIFGQKGESDK